MNRIGDEGDAALGATVTDSAAVGRNPPITFERGAQLGRHIMLERLGAGGMGEVYAAYDPELDRKIAVKILRTHTAQDESRLRREAQALARLSHPNVVAVYDVGVFRASIFVAMELV